MFNLEGDSQFLRELAKKSKDAKERERLRALYALSIGRTVQDVTEIFCVHQSVIYDWLAKWETEKNMKDLSKAGRPPTLDSNDKEEIKKLIEKDTPKDHGMNASSWSCRELCEYYNQQGRRISEEVMRRCLIGLGAHYVKADIEYAEANKELRKEFALQVTEFLTTKPEDVTVLFQDEASADCVPKRGYGWTFKKRLVIHAPQKWNRINCFGAVDPINGKVTLMTSKNAKAQAFIDFLDVLTKEYSNKKIAIYLDNLPVHKSIKTKKYLSKHPIAFHEKITAAGDTRSRQPLLSYFSYYFRGVL